MNVNEELKFLRKFTKKIGGGGGVGGCSGWGGGVFGLGVDQGGCERRIEVFVKIQNFFFFFFFFFFWGGGSGWM